MIGQDMTLTEAARLVKLLRSDPASQLAAAVEGWDYPFSRELAAAADLWDLEHAKAGPKKAARYPRPVKQKDEKVQRGDAAGRSPEEVLLALRIQPEAPV